MISAAMPLKLPGFCRSFRQSRAFFAGSLALALGLASRGPARAANASTPNSGLPGYEIVRLGRGHFNRLCLAAGIEGTKGLIIVDTGAGVTALSNGKYRFLLPGATRKLPAGIPATVSINGVKCPVTVSKDFHVGNVDLGAVPLCLVDQHALYDPALLYRPDAARQYDGLIGENLLRRYRAVVDCGRMALYLNTDPARTIHLGPALVRAGWTRVPMENFGNDFVVPCTIKERHFQLVVDTGAPFTDFDRDVMRLAELSAFDTNMSGHLIGSQATRMGVLRLDSLQIGDFRAADTLITAHSGLREIVVSKQKQASSSPVLGLLGGDFLSKNNALIDMGDHALYLKPGGSTGEVSPH